MPAVSVETGYLTNPEERQAMGDRAAILARERYDIRQMAQQYEQIYLEVLS